MCFFSVSKCTVYFVLRHKRTDEMDSNVIYSVVFVFFVTNINYTCSKDETHALSRHKRYVVFPEGASLTVAFCITMNLMEVPSGIFAQLINFGINYDLPNRTGYELFNLAEPKQISQRRHRRELYNKVEIILNAMGFDGRTCVYRTLCETSRNLLSSPSENILEEIIGRIFRFPLEKLYNSEPEDHRLYHWAHRMGHENQDCAKLFPKCDMSLLEMLLGYKK